MPLKVLHKNNSMEISILYMFPNLSLEKQRHKKILHPIGLNASIVLIVEWAEKLWESDLNRFSVGP